MHGSYEDLLAFVLVVLALVVGLLGLAGGVWAFVRTRRAARRTAELEAQLAELRARCERLEAAQAAPAQRAPEPAAAVQPAPVAEPRTHLGPVAAPPPLPQAAPAIEPLLEGLRQADLTEAAPAPAAPRPAEGGLERWLGVRGAALLGGIALAIAGFLFVQYSIEKGLLGPAARLALGTTLGLGAWGASALLARRGYALLANALYAGGSVALFAVCWAAHVLYGKVELLPAFGGMCAVTALSGWTAVRRGSLLVATLGLVGGFATPLVLSSGGNHPVQLFGYVLLLDLAYLFIATKRRWPSLATVVVLGTAVMQGLWIFLRAEPGDVHLALVILGVFALLFAGWGLVRATPETRGFAFARAAALLLPFVFASWFAHDARFGEDLWPLAVLALLLCAAAHVVASRSSLLQLPVGAAAGSVALVLSWTSGREFDLGRDGAWQLALSVSGIALALAAGLEFAGRSGDALRRELARLALGVYALPALLMLLAAGVLQDTTPLRPLVVAVAVLDLCLLRRLAHQGRPFWTWGGLLLGGLVLVAWCGGRPWQDVLWPRAWAFSIALAGLPVLLTVAAARFGEPLRKHAAVAVALHGLCAAWALALVPHYASGTPELAAATVVLAFAGPLWLAVRAGSIAAQAPLLFATHLAFGCVVSSSLEDSATLGWIVALGGTLLAALPLLRRGDDAPWPQRLGALLLLATVFSARGPFEHAYGLRTPLAAHAGFALVAFGLWRLARTRLSGAAHAPWLAAAAWFAAYALACVHPQWLFGPASAFFALLLAVAWKRLRHAPFAFGAGAAAILSALVLLFRLQEQTHDESALLLNAHAWNFLLPAAAVAAAATLVAREGPRFAAVACGIVAIVLGFAWINIVIIDGYADAPVAVRGLARLAQRDLVLSIAWASYSLALLVLGVRLRNVAARWGSLALLLMTIAKVFLLDLGRLEGLWRATSMLGLALSLLVVSFLYQRFVFQKAKEQADAGPAAG